MRTWLLVAASGAIGGSALPSWADTSLESFEATVTADEIVLDAGGTPGLTALDRDQRRKDTLDSPGLTTFTDTATKATGQAEIDVTAQVQGNTLTVDFMSHAEGIGAGAANGVGSTQGAISMSVTFTTTTDRLPWTLDGIARRDGPGTGSGTAQTNVRLRPVVGGGNLLSVFGSTDTVGDEVLAESGVLPAGSYVLTLSAVAIPQEQTGKAETVLDVTFRIGANPVEEAPIEWKSARNGSFGDPANWDPAQVPTTAGGRTDVASFDVAGSREYRVTVGTQHTTGGLIVGSGLVHFLSGRLSVVGYAPDVTAMEVGNDSLLKIGNDLQLTVRDAIVSGSGGGASEATVRVIGDGAFWTVTDSLQIGNETGSGHVVLEKGTINGGRTFLGHTDSPENTQQSRLSVSGTESVLRTGDATLSGVYAFSIDAGGEVQSEAVVLGPTEFVPVISVTGHAAASSETQSQWRLARLVAEPAPDGLRFLVVDAGGQMEVLGDALLASTYSRVQAPPTQVRAQDRRLTMLGVGGRLELSDSSSITVYPHGVASLDGDIVVKGGFLNAVGGSISLSGLAATPVGDVIVGTVPDSALDGTTQAFVNVADGGQIDTSTSGRAWRFGTTPESYGSLEIGGSGRGGSLFLSRGDVEFGRADGSSTALLVVHGGGRLETTARIVAHPSAAVSGDGAFVGEFVTPSKREGLRRAAPVFAAAEIACSEFEHHGTLTAGALRIEGDLTVAPGAVVVAEVAGPPSPKRLMPLTVTGTATLDGKLVLQFHDGYAPRAGEGVEFLDVQGAAPTGSFAEVEVRGLAPGAQFDVAADGGVVTATAVADTTALPSVSVKARGKKLSEKKTKKPAVFTFTRTGPTAAPLDVTFSVGGTATAGEDFATPAGTVTIPVGKKSATVAVQLTNDRLPEAAETLVLRVEASGVHTRGRTSRATLTVTDDDAPKAR